MARIFYHRQHRWAGSRGGAVASHDGHEVVLHARSTERSSTLADLASQAAGVAIGDLRSAAEIRRVAEQVNAISRMNDI